MGSRPDTPQLQILVVDADDASRVGLTLILRRAEGVAACFASADDVRAVALARRHRPDVALVDISQRGPFTGAIAAALRGVAPGIRLVLASRCARSAAAAVREARADAFVPAGSSAAAIVGAVLAAGDQVPAPVQTPALGALTEREREVLAGLVAGSTNREIGAEIHLGPDAVKKHASAIFRKLGVRNRTEAARFGREAFESAD